MVFSYINTTMLAQKPNRVRICKYVTLYQVFPSSHNANALSLRNFLSKHICIMHTHGLIAVFFVARGRGTYFRVPAINTMPLWHTPKHWGLSCVCVQACLESKPKWRIVSLDSPIISNNCVDPAYFLSLPWSLRYRFQVLSNFLLCCGIVSLTSQVNN